MFMQMETINESDSGDHMTISCELHRQDGEVQMILLIYMTCLHPHTVQQHKKTTNNNNNWKPCQILCLIDGIDQLMHVTLFTDYDDVFPQLLTS